MSFLRKTSLLLPLRFPPTTKYPFSSSAAALTKKRPSASAIKPEQPTTTLDGNVDASIATVMVHMQQNTAPQEEKNVLSSLKENVIAGEILKTSSSAFRRDKIHDIARGVADKFVNMEEEFQARRRDTNPSIVSKEFKPLPFQTMHPSAPQAADTAIPTPSSDVRPLPFQTSASRAALKSHTARAPVQSDWLADSDDVSGVSTTAPSFAASIDDISNSRVTGDVPHLDLAEAMEDTSVDELGRGAQKNRDYTASTPTFSSHVNHRNKSIDHDNGYGVSLAAQHEEQTATEIPPVNSTAPILLEPAASQASGGTMEDLACVNEPLVINENHQPSLGGYATGEHQIALGQAALRARFTQGDGPEVSINPGADSAIQSSRKYRPRV